MSTVAEILAAIKELSPQEQDEVKTYLRQRVAEDFQKTDDEKLKQKP
jgi:hypothetical protein